MANFKNDDIIIQTPKGKIVQREYTKGKNKGELYFRIEWNPGFGNRVSTDFSDAQRFVDSEVLRLSVPYLPFDTGLLQKSGILATEIGSGQVSYNTPYARRLYYNPQFNFDTSKHPQAGGHWFERMKADHKEQILKGAKKIAEGK